MATASSAQKVKRVFHIIEVLWAYIDIEKAIQSALEHLKVLVYFERALFWVMDPLTAAPARPPIMHNIPQLVIDYLQHIRPSLDDQAYKATKTAGLKIARSTDVLNYNKWTQTDLFHDIYLPYNGYYQLGSELREKNTIYGAFCLFRSQSLGNFSDHDVTVMRLLYPHLNNRLKWDNILNQSLLKPIDITDHDTGALASLTPRETEVVHMVLAGATNKEAAEVLHISENTVKLYLKNVYGKLGISTRTQLAALYHAWK